MKVLISSIILPFLLLLNITAEDSITITIIQNSYFSVDFYQLIMTVWGSLSVEDILTLDGFNDTRQIEFKQSWSKGNLSDTEWLYYDMFKNRYLENFETHVRKFSEVFMKQGPFIIQCLGRCTSSLDDTKDFTYRVALNGTDLVSINATDSEWTAGNSPLSKYVQNILQKDKATTQTLKIMLLNICYSLAHTYSVAGKEAYSKKIQPQVYITSKSKSETEVICMATGFYPKPINVSLWMENKMEDVLSTDTLPNEDGTYQITVLANINSAEQQSVYCQVEHSSLKEPMIAYLDKTHHSMNGLVIGIMVAVLVCVVGLACLVVMYKKRRRYTSIMGMTMERLSLTSDKNNG